MNAQPSQTEPREVPTTGIDVIDAQHGEILAQIAALTEANRIGHGAAVLEEVFIFLADYTGTHFAFEEFVMQGVDYPGLAAHRESHQAFVRRFEDLRRRFQVASRAGGDVADLSETTATWLGTWLTAHVKGEDTAMAEFLGKPKA